MRPGLRVDWQSGPRSEFKPASSFLLGAGFLRECAAKQILRCAQDDKPWVRGFSRECVAKQILRCAQDDKPAQDHKSWMVRSKCKLPLPAIPDPQKSFPSEQVNQ